MGWLHWRWKTDWTARCPGVVVFYDTRTRRQLGAPVHRGRLPDMLTFTPNGRQLLVANEARRIARPTPAGLSADDAAGSVSIIDVRTRAACVTLPIDAGHSRLRHAAPVPRHRHLADAACHLQPLRPGAGVHRGGEDGRYAYVGLQEANGIAVLNLKTPDVREDLQPGHARTSACRATRSIRTTRTARSSCAARRSGACTSRTPSPLTSTAVAPTW